MLPLLMLAGGSGGTATIFVAAHLVAIGIAWHATFRMERGAVGMVLDWVPLVLIPFMYAELPLLMAGAGATFHDAAVQGWEAAVFGSSPATTLAERLPVRWISEPLHAAYFSYYGLIFVPPAYLYLRRRHDAFAQVSFAVMAAFVVCFTVFAFFPVQGPRYLWPGNAVPDGPMRRVVVGVLERGSSRGAAFPSSHVAVAVVQSVMAARLGVPGSWLVAALTLGLAVGAVYGGFHYAIDSLAGAVVGGIVAAVAPWAYARVSTGRARGSGQESRLPVS